MSCALFPLAPVRYKEYADFCFLGSSGSRDWGKSWSLSPLMWSFILGSRSKGTGSAKLEGGCMMQLAMAIGGCFSTHGTIGKDLSQDLISQLSSSSDWRSPHEVFNFSCISRLCMDGWMLTKSRAVLCHNTALLQVGSSGGKLSLVPDKYRNSKCLETFRWCNLMSIESNCKQNWACLFVSFCLFFQFVF